MNKATAIFSILLLVSLSLQEIAYAVSLSEPNQVAILYKKLQTTLVVKKKKKQNWIFVYWVASISYFEFWVFIVILVVKVLAVL